MCLEPQLRRHGHISTEVVVSWCWNRGLTSTIYILPLSYHRKSWKRGREWVLELLLLPLLTKSLTSNSSKELWILIQTTKNKLLLWMLCNPNGIYIYASFFSLTIFWKPYGLIFFLWNSKVEKKDVVHRNETKIN